MSEPKLVDFIKYHYNPRNDLPYAKYKATIAHDEEKVHSVSDLAKGFLPVLFKHASRCSLPASLATYALSKDISLSATTYIVVGGLDVARVAGVLMCSSGKEKKIDDYIKKGKVYW